MSKKNSGNSKRPSHGRSVFNRLFGGKDKEVDILKEEQTQSPIRTIIKHFLHNWAAMTGLVVFLIVTAFCFLYTAVYPVDVSFQDVTQMNLAPGGNMMKFPQSLNGKVQDIDAGAGYGIAVDKDGNIQQWGVLPEKLKKIPDFGRAGKPVQISAGLDHALALTDKGKVVTWGNNRMGLSPVPLDLEYVTDVKQVEAGYQYSMVVTESGGIYIWGNQNIVSVSLSEYFGNVEKVVINISTALIITKDGEVYALSSAETPFSRVPEAIQGNIKDLAATDTTAAAVLDDGTVVAWGKLNESSLLVPEEIQGRVESVYAGRAHFTALLNDGTVASWGDNRYKQCNVPKGLSNVVEVSAGYHQNYAIDADGNIHSWGLKGYLMGTDQYGRDMFTRLLEGGKMTMTVGAISVIISTIIGIIIGGIAGYYGGRIDNLLMRFAEIVNSIPFLPLAMILSAIVAGKMNQAARISMIMVILGVLSWPSLARLVRANILAEREKEYITAAKAMGIKELLIVFKHIIPNIITTILVNITLAFASSMITESTLSFLGFGISEPFASWGNMLTTTTSSVVIGTYWWRWVFPAAALSICSISINLVGDGLREAIDPKSKER